MESTSDFKGAQVFTSKSDLLICFLSSTAPAATLLPVSDEPYTACVTLW